MIALTAENSWLDGLQRQPEAFVSAGGRVDAALPALPRLQFSRSTPSPGCGQLRALPSADQWHQLLVDPGWRHAQHVGTVAPSLQVLVEQHRPGPPCAAAQFRTDPSASCRPRSFRGSASSSGVPHRPSIQAIRCRSCEGVQQGLQFPHQLLRFAIGVGIRDDPAAGMGAQLFPLRIRERIRMLLSKLPSQSMRISDPQ